MKQNTVVHFYTSSWRKICYAYSGCLRGSNRKTKMAQENRRVGNRNGKSLVGRYKERNILHGVRVWVQELLCLKGVEGKTILEENRVTRIEIEMGDHRYLVIKSETCSTFGRYADVGKHAPQSWKGRGEIGGK